MKSLTENTQEIVSAFEDIKDAIIERDGEIGQCTSVSEYGDAIRNLPVKEEMVYSGTFMAFTETSDTPDTPEGGSWNGAGFEYPAGWGPNTSRARSSIGKDTWMSYTIVTQNTTENLTWSDPIKISGENGDSSVIDIVIIDGIAYWTINGQFLYDINGNKIRAQGIDGTNGTKIEFIFKQVADQTVPVQAPVSVNKDKYQPETWTLSAQGVSKKYQVEYVCMREKIENSWGPYSDPAPWSVYGVSGKDGNGIEYIFCLTDNELTIPTKPASFKYKDETEFEFPLSIGAYEWHDDPISVSLDKQVCWVAIRKQYYENDVHVWSEYSDPTIWTKYGKDGTGGRTIFAFTKTVDLITPNRPEGGSWNPNTNEIIPPTSTDYVWYSNADEGDGLYTWFSTADFNDEGDPVSDWTIPIRMSGTDGADIEFIYRLLPNYDTYLDLLEYLDEHPLVSNWGDVPVTGPDDFSKYDWTDDASGISPEYTVEICCVRTKSQNEYNTTWPKPTVWSKWGEDGIDGGGVEYIFKVTSADVTNNTINVGHPLYIPPKSFFDESIYQLDEFYPGNNNKWPSTYDFDWSDEPRDVGPGEPLEWVSIRRKIYNKETGKTEWGEFSTPALWAKWVDDVYAYFTSYVFMRSDENPGEVTGGNFDDPYPDDERWQDTIPSGNLTLWMTKRTFWGGDTDEHQFDPDWDYPIKMEDRSDFKVEYSVKESPTEPKSLNNYYNNYISDSELEAAFRNDNPDWEDEIAGAVWMATASLKNSKWSDWCLIKIKGEKGDKGDSITIKGYFNTTEELKAADTYYFNQTGSKPDPYFSENTLTTGDGYLVKDTGHLWIYDGSGDSFDERWYDVGEIKGEKGDSAYIYIRYSNDGSTFTAQNGLTPGKFIGILYSTGEQENITESDFVGLWQEWRGDDGFGQEQIFLLTSKNSSYNLKNGGPNVPTDTTITMDYCPDHNLGSNAYGTKWTDSPGSVSEDYPYQWVVTRKWDGQMTYPWKGATDESGNETGKAALYNNYAFEGTAAYHLELTQDSISVPCDESGNVDSDWINNEIPVQFKITLYAGKIPVPNENIYTVSDNNIATCDKYGNVTVHKNKLSSKPATLTCNALYDGVTYSKTLSFSYSPSVYEIEVFPSVIKLNKNGDPINDKLEIHVYKWSETEWINYNGYVHVDITQSSNVITTISCKINNGIGYVSISAYANLKQAEVYLNVNNEHKYSETIGVIYDGPPGKDSWSWSLSEPIELIPYDANGNPLNEISSQTTVFANCGGQPASVEITSASCLSPGVEYTFNGDTLTLTKLPGDERSEFIITIEATGTYQEESNKASLKYIVKKYFGTPATVAVHLGDDSVPVPTKSDGSYTSPISASAELIAAAGENSVKILGVNYVGSDTENVEVSYDNDTVTVTIGINATWNNDKLSIPIKCILDGNYGSRIVTMHFYKVRATAEAEYPDVFNLLLSPNLIYLKLDENGDLIEYSSNEVTPSIIVNKADGTSEQLSVTELYNKYEGSNISYKFDNVTKWTSLSTNTISINNSVDDADYSIQVRLTTPTGQTEIETVILSRSEIPSIDWELIPSVDKLIYNSEGTLVTTIPLSCALYKTVNGIRKQVTSKLSGFDVEYQLDDGEFNSYSLNSNVDLSTFNTKCVFRLILRDSTDIVWITKTVTKEFEPEDAVSVVDVIKQFTANSSDKKSVIQELPDSEWSSTSVESLLSSQVKYMWCREYTLFSDGSRSDYIYYIALIFGKGEPGRDAPIIYPAGIWNSTTTYVASSTKTPYVWYQAPSESDQSYNGYYLMIAPSSSTVSSTNEVPYNYPKIWEKMEYFSSIYADVGVLNQALVGSAVFYKDFMFSQDGYTQLRGGSKTSSYELFNPEDPFGDNNSFYPNVCFNFKTGDIWIQRQSLVVKNNSIKLGGWNVDSGSLYMSDSDRDIQMVLTPTMGFRIGTMSMLLKYIGLCPDGTAYFSNARFNNDGSGYLGGSDSDSSIIAWDESSVRIGFGDNAIIYNKNSSGVISKERNSINTRHYYDMTLSGTKTIIDLIGYEHNFLFREDESSFTIDFKLSTTVNSEIPPNGYCGTFVLSNASNYEKSVTINGWWRTTKTALNTIKIAAKTCQVWKLYVIGLSVWYLLKVS